MSRLVDIDDVKALIDDIYERDKDIINMNYKRNSIKDRIDELDTAYDIENVIEQLEKSASNYRKYYNKDNRNIKFYKTHKAIGLNKAIDIVKSGNKVVNKEKNLESNNIDKIIEELEDYGNEECSYYDGTPYKDVITECIGKALEIVKSNTNGIVKEDKNINNNDIKPKSMTKEYMLSIDELKMKFPIGSKQTINDKNYILNKEASVENEEDIELG